MLVPRDYQYKGIGDIRAAFRAKHRAPLYVLPTGGGKTVIFSYIAHGAAEKGRLVYILSHRVELIDQISSALTRSDTRHGFIASGYPTLEERCMVTSVSTLYSRLDKVPEPDMIIVDEAHHARARTWHAILAKWPKVKLLGVTATPMRPSGEGLGTIFDTLIMGPTPSELIAGNWLVQPTVYGPQTVDTSGLHTRIGDFIESEAETLINTPAITGNVIEHYREKADGLQALGFCISIKHAADVARQFREAGYQAISLSGKTDKGIRRDAVRDFKAGRIQIMTSADLFSEGFDCPGVHAGIMLRPTQSEVIYRQQAGRLMRPEENKTRAFLFDHVRNWERFGLPHWDREWSFDGDDKTLKKPAPPIKVCPKCFAAMRSAATKCPECGHKFAAAPREIEQRDGKLEEVEETQAEFAARKQRQERGFQMSQCKTLEQLQEYGAKMGYKPNWAAHIFAARKAKEHKPA